MIGTRLLDRYELLDELGQGGMGIVFRGRDPQLGREVAVKMIPPNRFTEKSEKRFQREARIVAQMDHPSIVPIFDFGSHKGTFFFVMPLLEGKTLSELVESAELTLGETVEVAAQVAEALDYSHSRGVIHRDVKPENVMVSREDGELRVRVMDFGLAQDTSESRLTETNPLRGTIVYMSPEQIRGADTDYRTDIYSLGVLLYECLSGQTPFTGTTISVAYRIVNHAPAPFSALGVEVDDELEAIVRGCLSKRPAERPKNGATLAALLRSYGERLDEGRRRRRPLLHEDAEAAAWSSSPLVGRDAEWRELVSRFEEARSGERQVVLVGGEVGTGKTRILDELEALARQEGIRALRGRIADRGALPYQGFCELVQAELRETSPGAGFASLAAELVTHFPALAEHPTLRQAAESAQIPPGEVAPPGDSTYLYELLARALTRLAAGEPRVLLLEGLHRGKASIQALDYVVRRLAATPTLIVGTYRPSEVGRGHPLRRMIESFHDDRRMTSLVLTPLTQEDLHLWLEKVLGSPDIDVSIVAALAEATEGNPFFCQELVRSLLEGGGLRQDADGVWTLVTPLDAATLPATVRQAVENRLEQLPGSNVEALSVASILGRNFDARDLSGLLEPGTDADAALDELVEAKVLLEDPASRGDRLSFASGVLRDVLYQDLPRRRRRSLHRRYAEALEKRFQASPERVYSQLVEHFSAGDVAPKTVLYALALARSSLAAFAHEDAIAAVGRGLELIDGDDVAQREASHAELLTIRARAYRGMGELKRALHDAERAAGLYDSAGTPGPAATAALLAARLAWQARRTEDVRRLTERGLELARLAGDSEVLRRLLTLAATEAALRGEHHRARELREEATGLARPEAAAEELPRGGHFVSVLAQEVTTVDPTRVVTVEEYEVAASIFETLLVTDSDGAVVAGLAETWQSSEDHRSWELVLRPGVRFSDGRPLAAADVKASIERTGRGVDATAVPALTVLVGFEAWRTGARPHIDGVEVLDERRLRFRLNDPLPIFPAFLTNVKTAVARATGSSDRISALVGTGPFRLRSLERSGVVLERNPNDWRPEPARLDTLELKIERRPAQIATGLLRGEIDLGRDLLPDDLEELLRQPNLRRGLVEATKNNLYFMLMNTTREPTANPKLRRALAGSVAVRDLVWRTLGRFAQPATGMIPPGIFGHAPASRNRALGRDEVRRLLEESGLRTPMTLYARVHPIFLNRYGSLTGALLEEWAEFGLYVHLEQQPMEKFRDLVGHSSGVDLLLSRWIADYDDADNFTYELLHSRYGYLNRYYSSPEADSLMERARQERDEALRCELYRQLEDLLAEESVVLPLFHEVDYRLAGPKVRGLELQTTPPYVNYARAAKVSSARVRRTWHRREGGEITIPLPVRIDDIDPAGSPVAERYEVVSTVFETLTRIDEGSQVVPWLAESFQAEEGGLRWRLRLRGDVRFHDGRRLTASDVRFTFERLLGTRGLALRFPLLLIRGAAELHRGEAETLPGLRVLSPSELVIELERPVATYPGLLAHPSVAIVPEGREGLCGSWRDGCVGTGPFRVAEAVPGERLQLERNPHYWRLGYPRAERLIFHLGVASEHLADHLRKGRFSVASGVPPHSAEKLRREPALAEGYRESPRLVTYFLLLDARRGPLADPQVRHAFVRSLDVEGALARTAKGWLTPARGLIPPGLLGYEPPGPERRRPAPSTLLQNLRFKASLIPGFYGPYAAFWEQLFKGSGKSGYSIEALRGEVVDVLLSGRQGYVDFYALRWVATYPDTDGFVGPLLDSRAGFLAGIFGVAEIDRLIEEARTAKDPVLRHTLYRRIEEILAEESLVVPLFYEPGYRFCQSDVRGLRLTLTVPEVLYEELYLERY